MSRSSGEADGGPVVGVGRGKDGGLENHVGHAVGPVFVVLATLVLHDVALDVELAVGERFEQVAHPVGFEP